MASFEIAAALMLAVVLYFLYRASVDLDEKHWQLKLGLFFGAVAFGWSAVNFALVSAIDGLASSNLLKSVELTYYAYSVISILAIIYLGLIFFSYTFQKLLGVVRVMLRGGKFDNDENVW